MHGVVVQHQPRLGAESRVQLRIHLINKPNELGRVGTLGRHEDRLYQAVPNGSYDSDAYALLGNCHVNQVFWSLPHLPAALSGVEGGLVTVDDGLVAVN